MNISRAINRVFSTRVLDALQHEGNSTVFDSVAMNYLEEPEGKTYSELFSEIYQHLYSEKRNEYFYQNTILLKLFLARHSTRTTIAFRQFHVANSIADFVMINGEGRAYEIKSDLDNFDRLESQLADYYTAFSKVSVVVPFQTKQRTLKALSKMKDFQENVGIYLLTPRGAISTSQSREPQRYDALLTHEALFKTLRKREYESIIEHEFGKLPDVTPVFLFRSCLELFSTLPIGRAQHLTMAELKTRNVYRRQNLDHIPEELKSLLYFSNKHYDALSLEKTLNANYQRNNHVLPISQRQTS